MRPSTNNEALLFRNHRLFAAAVICGWGFLAFFSMRQMYSFYLERGETPHLGPIFNFNVGNFGSWALLTPLILFFLRRWPPLPLRWFRFLMLVLAGVLVGLLQAFLATTWIAFVYSTWLQPLASFAGAYSGLVGRQLAGLLGNQIYYWAVVAIYIFANHVHRYRHNQMRLDHMTHQLESARLQALKMQLHPHFLFNTLNTISAMMHQNVHQADSMLAKLSDFLRLTLRSETKQFVTLAEEFCFLNDYLEIQQIRFRDRLRMTLDLPIALSHAKVPFLILQPLVENAIRHGFAKKADQGHLQVIAREKGAALQLLVMDNGPGLKGPLVEGIGWGNTRQRLETLFGNQSAFSYEAPVTGGFQVSLVLPLVFLPKETSITGDSPESISS